MVPNDSELRQFGGPWSDIKLSALRDYLSAYMRILSARNFRVGYIDAFAGAGPRKVSESEIGKSDEFDWDLETDEERSFRHGSPLIALETQPEFHSLIFIDRDEKSLKRLEQTIKDEGHSSRDVKYVAGDANAELQNLCRKSWDSHRAVAFLDPFAMQLEWRTIQLIARTHAIDMWMLFPAMAVNRMLTRSGEISDAWSKKLSTSFGTEEWRDEFYRLDVQETLFGEEESVSKVERIYEQLGKFVIRRLKAEFAGVYHKPLVLKNRSNTPIFLLCFACGNEKAVKPALRIAGHIIEKKSR